MDRIDNAYLRLNGLEKGLVLLQHRAQLILQKDQFLGNFVLLAATLHTETLNRHVLGVDEARVACHVAAAYVGDHHIVDYRLHVAFVP